MSEDKEVEYRFAYYNVNTETVEAVICYIPSWMADYIDSVKEQLIEAKFNYELFSTLKERLN